MFSNMKVVIGFFIGLSYCACTELSLTSEFHEDRNHLKQIWNSTISLNEGEIFTATVNDFSDKLMKNLDKLILELGLDPLPIPDIEKKISKRILFITYWGSLNLSKIKLKDVSTIHRQDDAAIVYNKATQKLQIDIPMAFDAINFDCHYKVRIMGLGPGGRLTGGMKDLRMITSIEIDMERWKASVKEYKITHSGHISVFFHVFILVDWLIDLLSNTTTIIFKGVILDVIDIIVDGTLKACVNTLNTVFAVFADNVGNSLVSIPSLFENIHQAIQSMDINKF